MTQMHEIWRQFKKDNPQFENYRSQVQKGKSDNFGEVLDEIGEAIEEIVKSTGRIDRSRTALNEHFNRFLEIIEWYYKVCEIDKLTLTPNCQKLHAKLHKYLGKDGISSKLMEIDHHLTRVHHASAHLLQSKTRIPLAVSEIQFPAALPSAYREIYNSKRGHIHVPDF